MELITAFFFQLASVVGVIAIFGLIIALLRRGFCALAPKRGPRILLVTGIVGTPIHELSHALMCLVFGHKIVEIKLFNPNAQGGSLGYVSHNYNKKNIYHQIGNFFIGTAPVMLGGAAIILLMSILVPSVFDTVMDEIEVLIALDPTSFPISEYFSYIGEAMLAVFSGDALSMWQGWVFILLAIMISSHMEMSGADIKNSLPGFAILAILLFLVDGVIYLISPDALSAMNGGAAWFGLVLSAFLSISVLFLISLVVVATLCRIFSSIFGR